jgi:hypothetical protein
MSAPRRKRKSQARREHELDRMVVAATWRRDRAKAGLGYKFQPPKRLRR